MSTPATPTLDRQACKHCNNPSRALCGIPAIMLHTQTFSLSQAQGICKLSPLPMQILMLLHYHEKVKRFH